MSLGSLRLGQGRAVPLGTIQSGKDLGKMNKKPGGLNSKWLTGNFSCRDCCSSAPGCCVLSLPTVILFAPEAQWILAGGETTGTASLLGLRPGRDAGRCIICQISFGLAPFRGAIMLVLFPVVTRSASPPANIHSPFRAKGRNR